MNLLASWKRSVLIHFNQWLFFIKGAVALGLVFLLGQQDSPIYLGIAFWNFVVLSILTDLVLHKFSPPFNFNLTEEETKEYKVSTEQMREFLITSPKVRLIRNGLALVSWGIFGLLTLSLTSVGLISFLIIFCLGPLLVDKLARSVLGIVTPKLYKPMPREDNPTILGTRAYFATGGLLCPGSPLWHRRQAQRNI